MIRILHAADIHACEKHLKWVDKALAAMVDHAGTAQIDAWVIAGDSFDSVISVHSPAYAMFLMHVMELAQIAPGLILAGTPSHDRPGSTMNACLLTSRRTDSPPNGSPSSTGWTGPPWNWVGISGSFLYRITQRRGRWPML